MQKFWVLFSIWQVAEMLLIGLYPKYWLAKCYNYPFLLRALLTLKCNKIHFRTTSKEDALFANNTVIIKVENVMDKEGVFQNIILENY